MRDSRLTTVGLVVLAVLQLSVPAAMIYGREMTISKGESHRLRTAPVDPYDAFRGRYVRLAVEPMWIPLAAGVRVERRQRVYVALGEASDGFAVLESVTTEKPASGAYVVGRVLTTRGRSVRLSLPIERYYMNEEMAPAAEAAYREHSGGETRIAYVEIRTRGSRTVVVQLYVDDRPIEEYLSDPG